MKKGYLVWFLYLSIIFFATNGMASGISLAEDNLLDDGSAGQITSDSNPWPYLTLTVSTILSCKSEKEPTEISNPLAGDITGTIRFQVDLIGLPFKINPPNDIKTGEGSQPPDSISIKEEIDFSIPPGSTFSASMNLSIGNELESSIATPVPGAIWLFGSGLIGLVGIRKKFMQT